MIDREARNQLALAIRRFAIGRLTTDQYESQGYTRHGSNDAALEAVFSAIDQLYGDVWPYRLVNEQRLNARYRRYLAQCVLFLRSDEEFRWSDPSPLPAWIGGQHDRDPDASTSFEKFLHRPICDFGCARRARLKTLQNWSKELHAIGPRRRAWPFSTLEHLADAKARPTYLCGSRKIA